MREFTHPTNDPMLKRRRSSALHVANRSPRDRFVNDTNVMMGWTVGGWIGIGERETNELKITQ